MDAAHPPLPTVTSRTWAYPAVVGSYFETTEFARLPLIALTAGQLDLLL
jgi:hypothetical protein